MLWFTIEFPIPFYHTTLKRYSTPGVIITLRVLVPLHSFATPPNDKNFQFYHFPVCAGGVFTASASSSGRRTDTLSCICFMKFDLIILSPLSFPYLVDANNSSGTSSSRSSSSSKSSSTTGLLEENGGNESSLLSTPTARKSSAKLITSSSPFCKARWVSSRCI